MSGRIAQALRIGQSVATQYAPTEAAIHFLDWSGTDDPMSQSKQWTLGSTWRGRVVLAMPKVTHGVPSDGPFHRHVITVDVDKLPRTPDEGDRVEIGGQLFSVAASRTILGTTAVLELEGTAAAVPTSGDHTPPFITNAAIVGATETFTMTADLSESAYYRYRYRKPPNVGSWVTIAYTGVLAADISGVSVSLDAGLYEVHLQAKDASGNESSWVDAGNVTITGIPA